MADDTKPNDAKADARLTNNRSQYQALGDEYTKAMSKAMAHLPLIGKPLAELGEALCNAGIGYRSLFPTECAATDDIVSDLRKQSLPSIKPELRGLEPEANNARGGNRRA